MQPVAVFVQIVGLLASYASDKAQQKSDVETGDIKDFLAWLATSGHNDIITALERNQATLVSLKALLSESTATVLTRIGELEKLAVIGSAGQGAFGQIALALAPEARLSTQQIVILQRFESLHAGKALLHHTYDGASLAFLDAVPAGAYQPDDPRFFDADMDELVRLNLLLLSQNSAGNKIFQLTRLGLELAKQLAGGSKLTAP